MFLRISHKDIKRKKYYYANTYYNSPKSSPMNSKNYLQQIDVLLSRNPDTKLEISIAELKIESKNWTAKESIKTDNTEVIQACVRMNEGQTCTDAIGSLQRYLNLDFCCEFWLVLVRSTVGAKYEIVENEFWWMMIESWFNKYKDWSL